MSVSNRCLLSEDASSALLQDIFLMMKKQHACVLQGSCEDGEQSPNWRSLLPDAVVYMTQENTSKLIRWWCEDWDSRSYMAYELSLQGHVSASMVDYVIGNERYMMGHESDVLHECIIPFAHSIDDAAYSHLQDLACKRLVMSTDDVSMDLAETVALRAFLHKDQEFLSRIPHDILKCTWKNVVERDVVLLGDTPHDPFMRNISDYLDIIPITAEDVYQWHKDYVWMWNIKKLLESGEVSHNTFRTLLEGFSQIDSIHDMRLFLGEQHNHHWEGEHQKSDFVSHAISQLLSSQDSMDVLRAHEWIQLFPECCTDDFLMHLTQSPKGIIRNDAYALLLERDILSTEHILRIMSDEDAGIQTSTWEAARKRYTERLYHSMDTDECSIEMQAI